MAASPSGHVDGVRRIGVLRANGIGDFLMIVPALEALRAAYPGSEITVIGSDWLPDLLHRRPGPWDRVAVAPHHPGLRDVPPEADPGPDVARFVDEYRGRYDIVVQMQGGGRNSNRFVKLLGPRVSVGARTPDADVLDRWLPYLPHRHEVLRWLEVASLVGAPAPRTVDGLVPRLTVTDEDVIESRRAWPEDEPVIAFHVGARDARRRWPAERFVEVARRLVPELRCHVVLVGGPTDRRLSRTVAREVGARCTDLTGRLSLSATLGLLSRCTLFVGNDSGPRHLATAAGTATMGVFWLRNALAFGPIVGAHDLPVMSFRVECPVCGELQLDRRCGHDTSMLSEVTVEAVLEAARTVLGAVPTRLAR